MATLIGKLEKEGNINWPSINGTGISGVVREVLKLPYIPGEQIYAFEKRLNDLYKVFKKRKGVYRDKTVGSPKDGAGAEAGKSPRED